MLTVDQQNSSSHIYLDHMFHTLVIVSALCGTVVMIVLLVVSYLIIKARPDLSYEILRLAFAGGIIISLVCVFLCGVYAHFFSPAESPGRGDQILDSVVTVVPPLITLVVGFYFGSQRVGGRRDRSSDAGSPSEDESGSQG